jgi:hypothetical protein
MPGSDGDTKATARRSKTTGAPPDNGAIPSLDGLRAISISIVLVSHAGYGSVVAGGLEVTIFSQLHATGDIECNFGCKKRPLKSISIAFPSARMNSSSKTP